MKEIFKIIVNVVHTLSFCGTMLAGALGALYEIIGPVKFEEMLSAMGISKGFERTCAIGWIMLLLLITTYFIKIKFFVN